MVELGKALLKSAEDGDTNEVKNLIGRGAPMTADWLGMLKRVSSVQINIYPHRDKNRAYNRTVNGSGIPEAGIFGQERRFS